MRHVVADDTEAKVATPMTMWCTALKTGVVEYSAIAPPYTTANLKRKAAADLRVMWNGNSFNPDEQSAERHHDDHHGPHVEMPGM